mgnify:CR=1 FL=1|jgi:hypothetical protein
MNKKNYQNSNSVFDKNNFLYYSFIFIEEAKIFDTKMNSWVWVT